MKWHGPNLRDTYPFHCNCKHCENCWVHREVDGWYRSKRNVPIFPSFIRTFLLPTWVVWCIPLRLVHQGLSSSKGTKGVTFSYLHWRQLLMSLSFRIDLLFSVKSWSLFLRTYVCEHLPPFGWSLSKGLTCVWLIITILLNAGGHTMHK